MLAADIYAKGLSHLCHGLPLWIPEPPEGAGALIGDVGYIYKGCFYRLFNATLPQDDPVNAGEVPSNFTVLECRRPLHRVDVLFPPGSTLCSQSVRTTDILIGGAGGSTHIAAGSTYRFTCNEDQGALLLLKDHASAQEIHPSSPHFIDYMRKHYLEWCTFALEKRGIELEPEHLVFVRGWVKTTEWAVAAFLHGGSDQELSFEADAGSFAKARFSIATSHHRSTSVMHRTGPCHTEERMESYPPQQDQCIFLSYFKLKRYPLFGFVKISAAAEPKDDTPPRTPPASGDGLLPKMVPDQDDRRSDGFAYTVESNPEHVPAWDPLDDVLDYILQTTPNADIAIASHLSLRALSWPPDNDVESALSQHRPPVMMHAGQVAMLESEVSVLDPPEVLQHILDNDSYAAACLEESPSNPVRNATPVASFHPKEGTSTAEQSNLKSNPALSQHAVQAIPSHLLSCDSDVKMEDPEDVPYSLGGHEHAIPGEGDRSEDLLSRIREKSQEIDILMSELHKADCEGMVVQSGSSDARSLPPTLVDSSEAATSTTCWSEEPDFEGRVMFTQKHEYTRDWLEAQKAKKIFDDCVDEVNILLQPMTNVRPLPQDVNVGPRQPQYATQSNIFSGTFGHPLQQSMNSGPYQDIAVYSQFTSSPSPARFEAGPSQVHESAFSSPPVGFAPSYPSQDANASFPTQTPYFESDLGPPDMFGAHAVKRPRIPGQYEHEHEPEAEGNTSGKVAEAAKRPACQRCKGLKVKCEFKTDPDICKRCLNGGHECVIPGRKKRRAPPKREHLLSWIREQAELINSLMSDLEKAQRKASEAQAGVSNAPSPQSTTGESIASLSTRLLSPDYESVANSPDLGKTTVDVQDWLAKARQSMETFGGYFRFSGLDATRDMIAEEAAGEQDTSPYVEPRDGDDDSDMSWKRPQIPGQYEHEYESETEGNTSGKVVEAVKRSACQRCKGLRIKCEFKTEPDICKRCLNGGHECVIPGQKRRRPPPKREHLLSQIREQAERINGLMSDLEKAQGKANGAQARVLNALPPQSTTRELTASLSTRPLSSDWESYVTSPELGNTTANVQDWLAEARQSVDAFGGHSHLGTPGVTRDMVVEEAKEGANMQDTPLYEERGDEADADVEGLRHFPAGDHHRV